LSTNESSGETEFDIVTWLLISPPTGVAILDQLLKLTQQSFAGDDVPIDLA